MFLGSVMLSSTTSYNSGVLLDMILSMWTVLLLIFLTCCLAGIIIWALVSTPRDLHHLFIYIWCMIIDTYLMYDVSPSIYYLLYIDCAIFAVISSDSYGSIALFCQVNLFDPKIVLNSIQCSQLLLQGRPIVMERLYCSVIIMFKITENTTIRSSIIGLPLEPWSISNRILGRLLGRDLVGVRNSYHCRVRWNNNLDSYVINNNS